MNVKFYDENKKEIAYVTSVVMTLHGEKAKGR